MPLPLPLLLPLPRPAPAAHPGHAAPLRPDDANAWHALPHQVGGAGVQLHLHLAGVHYDHPEKVKYYFQKDCFMGN